MATQSRNVRGSNASASGESSFARGKGASARKGDTPSQTETTGEATTAVIEKALTSFDIFELCVQRARNLVKLHEEVHGKKGKPEKYTSDAHRAAIVLAVSALDAFVRDYVIFLVRNMLAKSLALPPSLSSQIKRFLKEDELLEAARRNDLLDRVDKAFRNDFERRSFQGTRIIEEYMEMAGQQNVFHEVAVKAGLNEDTLRDNLDRFTQRRHEIAHRGDYDLSENPPKENPVTKKDANDCIRLVCSIAMHIHKLGTEQ